MSEPLQVTPVTAAQTGTYIYDLGIHGVFKLTFTVPGVTSDSVVMVSMTELANGSNLPFVGDATLTVHNVAPGNGTVQLRGEVDWDSDLSVRVSFLIA
ncbi:hypothetical protein OG455_34145 [Kitasatospora sp. NBC_01287]|uniref:hypothetical protein n=1 Tax=Kitasatospora sp. NBC_01287 TaxID=2903573 RepID=UPI002259CD1B|nr:hypothetical protein [Kitasatospora sp. NBC_01287]MCX4750495.1 hypothetical protein [Kitasatospora sp. NBC_01287]